MSYTFRSSPRPGYALNGARMLRNKSVCRSLAYFVRGRRRPSPFGLILTLIRWMLPICHLSASAPHPRLVGYPQLIIYYWGFDQIVGFTILEPPDISQSTAKSSPFQAGSLATPMLAETSVGEGATVRSSLARQAFPPPPSSPRMRKGNGRSIRRSSPGAPRHVHCLTRA